MKIDELTTKYLVTNLEEALHQDLQYSGRQALSSTITLTALVLGHGQNVLLVRRGEEQYLIRKNDIAAVEFDNSLTVSAPDNAIPVKLTILKDCNILRISKDPAENLETDSKKPTVMSSQSAAKAYSVPENQIQSRDSARRQTMEQAGLGNLSPSKVLDDQVLYNSTTGYDSKETTSYQTAHDTNTQDMGKPVITTDYAQETSIDITTDYSADEKRAAPNARTFDTAYDTKAATMVATSVETKSSKFGISQISTDSLEDPSAELNTDHAADIADG